MEEAAKYKVNPSITVISGKIPVQQKGQMPILQKTILIFLSK